MHQLVDLASERQIANCNTEFEDEADVLREARPIQLGGVIQQPLTGHLNGMRGQIWVTTLNHTRTSVSLSFCYDKLGEMLSSSHGI